LGNPGVAGWVLARSVRGEKHGGGGILAVPGARGMEAGAAPYTQERQSSSFLKKRTKKLLIIWPGVL
jgi:hypothetical protein